MVQMSAGDQSVIKAMEGNDRCMECKMKNPTWASVSFGTLFCLECSGVHRSLGVHISFVRSVAMDSWSDDQLGRMKAGGNAACARYLQTNGVTLPRSSADIHATYHHRIAQHYKDVLSARVAGRPDPAVPVEAPSSAGESGNSSRGDPNGMERLRGETDQEYIARQTRLREEAKARMARKFGNGGGMGMGGMGMGGRKMGGVGSDPNYHPGGGGGGVNVDGLVAGFGTALSTLGQLGRKGADLVVEQARSEQVQNLGHNLQTKGVGLWSSLSSAASDFARSVAEPDDDDGLAGLRQKVSTSSNNSSSRQYEGFGSDMAGLAGLRHQASTHKSTTQYQGFGPSSSMSSSTSASMSSSSTNFASPVPAPAPAPTTNTDLFDLPIQSLPNSHTTAARPKPKPKPPVEEDFFASFGT